MHYVQNRDLYLKPHKILILVLSRIVQLYLCVII